jgi:hypothetical protein
MKILETKHNINNQFRAFNPKSAHSKQKILQQKQQLPNMLSLEQYCCFVVLPPHLAPSLMKFSSTQKKNKQLSASF